VISIPPKLRIRRLQRCFALTPGFPNLPHRAAFWLPTEKIDSGPRGPTSRIFKAYGACRPAPTFIPMARSGHRICAAHAPPDPISRHMWRAPSTPCWSMLGTDLGLEEAAHAETDPDTRSRFEPDAMRAGRTLGRRFSRRRQSKFPGGLRSRFARRRLSLQLRLSRNSSQPVSRTARSKLFARSKKAKSARWNSETILSLSAQLFQPERQGADWFHASSCPRVFHHCEPARNESERQNEAPGISCHPRWFDSNWVDVRPLVGVQESVNRFGLLRPKCADRIRKTLK